MLEDLNCTMDKTDRDGEKKKKHKYFIVCSNYALTKLLY